MKIDERLALRAQRGACLSREVLALKAENDSLRNFKADLERLRDDLAGKLKQAKDENARLMDQSNLSAKVEQLRYHITRLCNEAAVLCVHCDGVKDGGLGAFATAREFTKVEIANARKANGE